jgi:GT2 family glycosyltransferase
MASAATAIAPPSDQRWHAIVLNWNGREDTLRCLGSLLDVEHPNLRVVCVDNGSADGSQDAIRQQFPDVLLIEAGANLGYSGGNNLGIRAAIEDDADWVMLVNNDATVAPDVVHGFAKAAARDPHAGILAGKVFFADRPSTIWFAGQRVSELLGYSGRPRGYGRPDGARFEQIEPTGRAVGALMAVSRAAIDAVGVLDEDLFAYVEDVDWALRVRAAGMHVLFAPGARAWHRVSASSGGEAASTLTLYYGVRNTVTVLERRRPLGVVGSALRRGSILATFTLHALTRRDRRAALDAVRSGFDDARHGRLGIRGGSGHRSSS